MKLFMGVIGVFAMLSAAYASEPSSTNPQSKENQVFEAQGNNNILKSVWDGLKFVAKKVAENSDGTLTISDSFISSTMGDSQQLKINLETRVYGFKESTDGDCGCYNPGVLILPMEVRIRANVNDPSAIDMTDFKVGAVRLLLKKYSLTFQALSYYYKKNEIGVGSYDGFEVVNATFSDVTDLSSSGKIELVYKLSLGIGFSGMYSNIAREAAKSAQGQSGIRPVDGDQPKLYLNTGASIGVRFAKTVLVDFFGGYTRTGDNRQAWMLYEDGSSQSDADLLTTLKERFYGAGLRYEPSKYFNARVSAQHNSYESQAGYYGLPDGAQVTDKQSSNSVTGSIEVRW